MKRLMPGVYDDERGGLHIRVSELLVGSGVPDTPENRDRLVAAAIDRLGPNGIPIVVTDDRES